MRSADAGLRESVASQVRDASGVLRETGEALSDRVVEAATLVVSVLEAGGRLLICGNGGSAADSQHMAAELVSSYARGLNRRALSAIALTTDSSILTAFSNDFSFDGAFSRQVEAHGRSGDCLIAISTSGQSRSVIAAAEQAKALAMSVVALTGMRPTPLSNLANIHLPVPSDNTQHIQLAHLLIEHLICEVVDSCGSFDVATGGVAQ